MDPVSGRRYFANRSTGETRWDPPPYFPPLAPPPPAMKPPPAPQEQYQQVPTQPRQLQMIHAGAQPVVGRQITQPAICDLQATNITPISTFHNSPNMYVPLESNYFQRYPPIQPQVVEMTLSKTPNTIISTQQQIESMSTVVNSTLSSGLGPSTAVSLGMLVPSVRAMIDAENKEKVTQNVLYVPPKLELEGLTAGAIADLCNVSRDLKAQNVDGGDFAGGGRFGKQDGGEDEDGDQCYTPLRPFSLPVSSVPPHIEPGRVDIRLHALHRELGRI
jgi:hypothetical protein